MACSVAFATGIHVAPCNQSSTRRKERPANFAFPPKRWALRAVQELPVQAPLDPRGVILKVPTRPSKHASKRPTKEPKFEVEGDFVESTPLQRLKVFTFFALTSGMGAKILLQLTDLSSALQAFIGVFLGYLFADFGTGVYHWAVDNYGNADTPVFGYQIAAFQGHHSAPWTITNRAFANNLHRLTDPTSPQMLLLLLASLPIGVEAFATSALLFIVLSQEFHRQAHFTRPGLFMGILQRAGLCVSRKMHGNHHKNPYGVNYCIVSGICNQVLDDSKVFRRMEGLIFRLNGVEPNTWTLDPSLKTEALEL